MMLKEFFVDENITIPFKLFGKTHLFLLAFVLVGLLIWICLFCSIVTKKTVKRTAFDYAKTLLEIIENLSQEEIAILR